MLFHSAVMILQYQSGEILGASSDGLKSRLANQIIKIAPHSESTAEIANMPGPNLSPLT